MQAAYVSQGTGANRDYSLLVHEEEIAKTPKLPQGKNQNQKNFIILFNLMIMRFFLKLKLNKLLSCLV